MFPYCQITYHWRLSFTAYLACKKNPLLFCDIRPLFILNLIIIIPVYSRYNCGELSVGHNSLFFDNEAPQIGTSTEFQ